MRRLIVLAVIAGALSVAAPAGAGGGGCHEPATNDAATTVPIESLCFSPTVTEVGVGETVTWVNNDPMEHDVAAVGGAWGSVALQQGEEFSQTFDAPGVYVYVCRFHPGMAGAVNVLDEAAPIAAVTPASPADNGDGPGLAGAAIVIFVLLATTGAAARLLLRRPRLG